MSNKSKTDTNERLDSSRLLDAKVDQRPKRGWWAPGDYFNKCRICEATFIGDKRAGHCADCAYDNELHDFSI